MVAKWKPIKVAEVELDQELKPISALEGYTSLYLLVRYRRQPLGWVWLTDLDQATVTTAQLRAAIKQQLGWEVVSQVLGGQPAIVSGQPQAEPPISVVVYAPSPIHQVEGILPGLLALDYPNYEIIVVGNEPARQSSLLPPGARDTLAATGQPPVRYIYEEKAGLAQVRNRGLAEARCPMVAFIDPAARPDRHWLRAMAGAFADPGVMAVTGLVAPAELETRAQMRYEFDYGGLGRGLRRRTIHRGALTQNYSGAENRGNWHEWFWRGGLTDSELLSTDLFGVGNNMAFRRELFSQIEWFDAGLDPIAEADGSAIEMFHRLVSQGHTLVYEPAALVWQTHSREDAALRRLVYDQGRAYGAYLLACVRRQTVRKVSIMKFAAQEYLGQRIFERLYRPDKLPRHILWLELAGLLVGPLTYIGAQFKWLNRKAGPVTTNPCLEAAGARSGD